MLALRTPAKYASGTKKTCFHSLFSESFMTGPRRFALVAAGLLHPRRCGRARFAAALSGLAFLWWIPAAAQETRWKELDDRLQALLKDGKTTEALPLALEALAVAEASLGPEHPETKPAIHRLGVNYLRENKDNDAEKVFHRRLASREKTLRAEHSDVAITPINLGSLAIRQKNYANLKRMWPLLERETQELMSLFYASWLGGLDQLEALRQAQLKERETVRQRYGKDLPYYWGAFVLVGR
jgi:hypothetical protein